MPSLVDPDFAPFGWSVGCVGRKAAQVREEVRGIVEQAIAQWQTYFPRERGYRVAAESPAGPSNGVRLLVQRGDFRASMSIESILDPKRKSDDQWAVRVYGRAESTALATTERDGHQVVQRSRTSGVIAGLGLFLSFCWLAIGVHDPVFWLGGLLMVVAALLTTTVGGALGTWVGERLAERRRHRALTGVCSDPGLEMDLKRWRALTRQLVGQRNALMGRMGSAPFRELPQASREASRGRSENSRPLPRITPGLLAPTG